MQKLEGLWYHGEVGVVNVETQARSYSPITIKIEFDVLPMRIQDLETSKKLLIGSLVLLICDKTLICASVAARDEDSLRNRVIYITPIVPFDQMGITVLTLLQKRRFYFFESCIYFEAYQHVLKSLNKTVKLPLSLEQYFISSDTKIEPPEYLKDMNLSEMSVDVSCLYSHGHEIHKNRLLSSLDLYKHLHEDLLNMSTNKPGEQVMSISEFLNISSTENLRVNASQLESIKSVFNHRISLLQGPPGTGKSYVGKLIVQLLLANRKLWQSKPGPILVVCYTNRALDSFLEDMLGVTNKVIRIGGRSKSEALEIHNLQSLKKGKKN